MKLDGLTFMLHFLAYSIKGEEGPNNMQSTQRKKLFYILFLLFAMMFSLGLLTSAIQLNNHLMQICLHFYSIDFYQPLQEDELEQSTIVQIIFPAESKPVFCEFDWDLNELEEFTDKLIEEEELSEDQKDAFKDFVKEKVREAKKANREAREAQKKALEEMSDDTKNAFQNMKFYKFYPVPAPDAPDVSNVKQ